MERLTTNIIPPSGPLDAKMCFIGEAPGEEEDYGGEVFIGSAGQFQDRCFSQVGIVRSRVLLTNVFWQKPPRNDVGYFYTDKSKTKYTWEGQEHLDNLKEWLSELFPRPNVLIAVGRTAMYALTGKKRIWKWRGSILPCTLVEGYKVYCTLHPSGVLRAMNEPIEGIAGEKKVQALNALPLYLLDLQRAKEQAEFPELRYPVRKFDLELDYNETCEKLRWINEANKTCAIDIETYPGGPEGPLLWMIGFSPSPDYAFVVYMLKNHKFCWSLPQEAQIMHLISEYFLNPNCQKIFQFGNYDMSILGRYYGLRLADGTYEDTMWCHHAAFPQIKKSLETLTSIYTWEPYYKDEGKVNFGKRSGDLAEARYNAKDCCVTREIFPIVMRQAKELSVWSGYRRSMSYMPSLLAMMIRGVRTDVEHKLQLEKEFKVKSDFYAKRLCEREGEQINLNSSQQVIKLLYYKHQLREQRKRTKKRQLTADKDALQKLKHLYPNNATVQDLIEYKKFAKLHSTYAKMKLAIDGRIRTSYSFVSTWRLSSSSSPFDDGGNLQNIPVRTAEGKQIRTLFLTDPMPEYPPDVWPSIRDEVLRITQGKVKPINGLKIMVARDLSQAEARYVVWDAEDLRMIEMFLDPDTDVHWERTKDIFGLPRQTPYEKHEKLYIDLVKQKLTMYDLRRLGKTAKHAGNYGMGPYKFLQILAREGFIMDFRVAKGILHKTVDEDPFLQAWHKSVREKLRAYRMLETPLGRRRYFYHSRMNDNLYRAGYAFCPQSTVGELLEDAIQQTFANCADYIDILLNIHDEIIYQVAPHRLADSLHATQKYLEIPLEIKGRTLIIPAEAKAGYNWGELHEFTPQLEE